MVRTTIDGTLRQTNLTNESSTYLAKREELRLAEIELMRQRERVAEMRRNLPQGAPVQDYQFEEGPMCTAWLDGANGVAHHLAQNLDFAVAAAADLPTLRAHARARGWDKLRLLSAGNSTFKYDFGSEDREGRQDSTVSVFIRDADATLRHFYTAHPWMAPDIRERGIDLLAPIWHFMDLTPQGRGNWYTSLDYGTKVQAAST
jgi:predicted dithiol-disulfide oxidoreductase (DUF899 family)